MEHGMCQPPADGDAWNREHSRKDVDPDRGVRM
jgi:hypothetical protein